MIIKETTQDYYKCANCGKKFFMPWETRAMDYVYKYKTATTNKWFCSYTCWNKNKPESRRYKRR